MAYSLACRDVEGDCPYVARGETEEEVLGDAAKHAKGVHGYTDEQVNDPELIEKLKTVIKQT